MENIIKISVIVPIYNSEKYLKRCINSIINQSIKEIEMILINDGSNDNSFKIIEEYCELDNRIRKINKKNTGMSDTRNLGIKESKGEYVIFIDSDDWIDENMLFEMYRKAKHYNSEYIRCGYIKEFQNKKIEAPLIYDSEKHLKKEQFKEKIYLEFINNYNLNSACLGLVKRSVLIDNDIFFTSEYKYGEDYLFNMKLFTNLNDLVFLPNYYYHYFYNNNSATTNLEMNNIKEKIISANKVYSKLYKYIKKWDMEEYNIKVDNRIKIETFLCMKNLFYFDKIIKYKEKIFVLQEISKHINLKTIKIDNKKDILLKFYINKNYKMFLLFGHIRYGIVKYIKNYINYIGVKK